jgi:hypothetical protein
MASRAVDSGDAEIVVTGGVGQALAVVLENTAVLASSVAAR